MKDFESIARKIRALQTTVGHPTTPQGEREAAQASIERLCERHGLSVADIENIELVDAVLCVNAENERALAFQLLSIIGGWDVFEKATLRTEILRQPGKGRRKARLVPRWTITARMPKLEADDWKAAYAHYLPMLWDLELDLDRQLKIARRAVKQALQGFLQKFNLFSDVERPMTGKKKRKQKPLSAMDWAAMMAAYQAAKGDKWERGTGKLTDLPLLTGFSKL